MISAAQIDLNVAQAYSRYIRAKFTQDNYLASRYLFVLQIREGQLERKLLKRVATLENLQTLKTGHRAAERFYLDISGGSPRQTVHEISEILQSIAVEFHAEIAQIEAEHPHLRAEFAREREEYRLMWNDYVTERQQNE
jgi:hypothetical protein